jgi:predicted TIM-barrel fold metal-dependent hydrolase
MLTRRQVLVSAGVVSALGRANVAQAAASQPSTPVKFNVPPGACDCHTHVFGDPRRFSFAAGRVYTPEPASVIELRAMHRSLGIVRVVIVQPSVYGSDNRCTLEAIRQLGGGARGVAVIDDQTRDSALDEMGHAGICGIRINLETDAQTDPGFARQRLQWALDRVRGRGWHIQIYTRLSVIEGIQDQVLASTVPVVFDHFGRAQARLDVRQPGFPALLNLVGRGKAYVKLSGAYYVSTRAPDYPDVTPLARALIAANPERILWGSDWPHPDSSKVAGRKPTDIAPLQQIDDGRLFNQLAVWAPDAAERKTILVENPARLYGPFPAIEPAPARRGAVPSAFPLYPA